MIWLALWIVGAAAMFWVGEAEIRAGLVRGDASSVWLWRNRWWVLRLCLLMWPVLLFWWVIGQLEGEADA
jgi:hypothetical protein